MSQTDSNPKLFQDPQIIYPTQGEFSHYISQCKHLIKKTRVDLEHNEDIIIEANSPFEFKPKPDGSNRKTRHGALLIHGLYDSPFIMRDIGRHLQAQGLHVQSILLPGHGTVPGAMLNVTYQEWIQATHYGVTSLSKEVDKVFLVGFSTGASLSLYHTLNHTYENIAGLILLAPAIQLPFLSVITNLPPKAGFDWLTTNTEIDYSKYRSFTFNSVYQLYQLTELMKEISATVERITCPVFVVISQDDRTVNSGGTLKYFHEYSSEKSKLLVYTNFPKKYSDPRIITRPAAYPDKCIHSISHIALPIAPNNFHYGIHGDYVNASHVEKNLQSGKKIIYDSFNDTKDTWRKLLYNLGLSKHQHKRLTFNPDFEFLQAELGKFIQDVCG
jgi:esterase/lipase